MGLLALALVAVGIVVGERRNSSAQAATTSTTVQSKLPFILSIGGSSSVGMQPTGIIQHNGRLTADSYPNMVAWAEARIGNNFELHHDGCPGETARSMIEIGSGGHCNTNGLPQLVKATNFLKENQYRSGVVIIDIGFNDVRPCLKTVPVQVACAAKGLNVVRNDLPKVLTQLKDAAGPNVTFVGLQYYDAFLGRYLWGPAGAQAATASLAGINQLNAVLQSVYTNAGMKVADVPSKFQLNDNTPVKIPNVGTIPMNVYQECLLTWGCQPKPFGPDDHPNNAGYMNIAEAIMAQLPGAWQDGTPQ